MRRGRKRNRRRRSSPELLTEGVQKIKEKKVRRLVRKMIREERNRLDEAHVSEEDEETLRRLGFSRINSQQSMLYQNNLPSTMVYEGDLGQTWLIGATHDEPEEVAAFLEFGDGAGAIWEWDSVSGNFRDLMLDTADEIARLTDGRNVYDVNRGTLGKIERAMNRLGADYTYS